MTEILETAIILALIGFLFYKEKQHQEIIKEILASKLSKDIFEFKNVIEKPKEEEETEKEEEEVVPIEEAPAEKLLEALKK
jgi:hypothetical protein